MYMGMYVYIYVCMQNSESVTKLKCLQQKCLSVRYDEGGFCCLSRNELFLFRPLKDEDITYPVIIGFKLSLASQSVNDFKG